MKPVITKYLDLSQYLQDFYAFRKSQDKTFSYQRWARDLGIKNKSYLRFVVLGRRPLTEKTLAALAKNLELGSDELLYLQALTQYSQAKNGAQKKVFGQALIKILKTEKVESEIEPHYELLSNPLLTKLLTLLSFEDIRKDNNTLAHLLMATVEEVAEGIRLLEKLGAVEKDGDVYKSTNKSFRIADDFNGLGLRNFYNNLFEEARAAISLPKEQRKFRSLFVPMSESEMHTYLENLNSFAKEQLVQYDFHELKDRRIYQLHFNVFPVTQTPAEEQRLSV